jgi:alpha-D-ribose 1-methylphosphonate 5-triphosphate synthase subunit PhnG
MTGQRGKEIGLMNVERSAWTRALTAHAAGAVKALAERLATDCEVKLTRLPQAGLGLLTVTDGAFHQPYYLGEFPVSACSVEITGPDGRRAEGGCSVMADDAELARALAILDAILVGNLPGAEQVCALVASGARLRAEEDRRRRAVLAATRVDFAMLSSAEQDDDAG